MLVHTRHHLSISSSSYAYTFGFVSNKKKQPNSYILLGTYMKLLYRGVSGLIVYLCSCYFFFNIILILVIKVCLLNSFVIVLIICIFIIRINVCYVNCNVFFLLFYYPTLCILLICAC